MIHKVTPDKTATGGLQLFEIYNIVPAAAIGLLQFLM